MQRRVCNLITGVALAVASMSVVACGAKAKTEDTGPKTTAKAAPKADVPINATIQPSSPSDERPPPGTPIYFDFDSYQVADSSKSELQKVADYLSRNPKATVTIAGNTDERGTTEYNLMLGDQRAKAAHDYLVRLGIDPLRIKTISFGEERPAAQGQGEDIYKQNRRDEFNTSDQK